MSAPWKWPPAAVVGAIVALLPGPAAIAADARFRVVDGDTMVVVGPAGEEVERIRLANIDAPEIFHVECPAEREAGVLAAAHLIAILRSGDIVVSRIDRDRYGRTLAIVTVDGADAGDRMVADGYARPWRGHKEQWCGGPR